MLTDDEFEGMVAAGIDAVPEEYARHLKNVAIVWQDEPTPEQRVKLRLRDDQTLFGLYEGVPLTNRAGVQMTLPDKITIFKYPIEALSSSPAEIKEQVRHTVWHEVAHYFGLDHDRIHGLE
jgi:predicted Zn-dependent protease with MMP-like domain